MNTSQEKSFGHDALGNSDEQVSSKLSSRKKVKKKKQKREPDVLEKSDMDQSLPQEVGSAVPNKMVDCVNSHVKIDLNSPEKRGGNKNSEHDVLGKSVKDKKFSQEVVTVQLKHDPCPQDLDNFIQKVDTENDQVNAESCSSNKKKSKRKKKKEESGVLGKNDKDQDCPPIVDVHPNLDQCLQIPASNCLNLKCQEAAGVQPVSESAELVSSQENLIPRRQGVSLVNENTVVLLPNVPSSGDFVKKKDINNDVANVELNSSDKRKAKGKKQKRVKNVMNKSVKDQVLPEDTVTLQPNLDQCIQSPDSKFCNLRDEVRNYGAKTVVQSVLEVAGMDSRRDDCSLMPGKQSGSLQNKNALEVQDVQPCRDLCQPSSNDSIKRADTEKGQVNSEVISLKESKIKRKKKKQKMGDNVLDKSDKAQDTVAEVLIVQPKSDTYLQSPASKLIDGNCSQEAAGLQSVAEVAVLGSGRDTFLMQGKQIVPPKNENTSQVKAVQPSGDSYQLPTNYSTKKPDTESEQVITELGLSNKSTIKRKTKKKSGAVSIDKSGKDQDLQAVQPSEDSYQPPSNDFTNKMDTGSEQVIAELSSSNDKSTIKREKKKRRTVSLDKSDKGQDLQEEQVLVQPERDMLPILGVAEVGPRRDNFLVAKQSDSLKNENALEIEADLSPPSHGFIKKMETGSEIANAVTSSSDKKKRKRKKQKRGNDILDKSDEDQKEEIVVVQPKSDQGCLFSNNQCLELEDRVKNYYQEAANVQPVSDGAEVDPTRHNLLMLAKQSDSLNNENAPEVEAVQPNRHSSHDFIKKVGTRSELENVGTSSSSKLKRKRKKQKKGNDILDKSDKDQKEEVVSVQPKCDQSLLLSTNQCLELEDTVKDYDKKVVSEQPVSEVSPRRDDSLMTEKQICSLNNENSSELEAEQPKRYPCPQPTNDFNKKMDIESNQVHEELCSSNKREKKKKKLKRGNEMIDKSDKDHNLMEQVMTVKPKSDLLLSSPADRCVQQEDTVSHECHADVSGQSASVVVELGSGVDSSLTLGKQISSLKNENTAEDKAVQPNRDQCPSSNDFKMKVDAESDRGTEELSLSRKKRKKKKKQDDVLDKSDKDHKEDAITFQPKTNLLLQSHANKSLELEDTVKNCAQEAVVSQVSKLVSRVDNSLMMGKEVGSVKNENTLGDEAVQTRGDLHPPSSTDFNKKMDTESDQVNAESSTSNKKKRKRKKQKTGDNIIEKSEKDHDLADGVVAVRPNRDLYPPSNDFIKKTDTDSDQVNADSNLPNKKKTKKKKQKIGKNVPNKSDKVQDVPKEVQGPIPDVSSRTKKLIILDINGLLVEIVPYGGKLAYKPDTTISRKAVFKRPFCDDFLQFCFERFDVAVWSSRTKDNLDMAVKFLLRDYRHKLIFCWDQSHCTRTKFYTLDNKQKPLVLKELKKVWEKMDPKMSWEKGAYNESNTLLIDDSPYKALRNPAYTAIFPHPYQHTDASDASLGPGGDLRVYLEGLSKAENTQKYVEENPFGQETIKDTDPHWHFYSKILQTN